jgi:hypothetical protein
MSIIPFYLTFVILTLLADLGLSTVAASESVRSQEINQCLNGEMITWGDGRDRPAINTPLKFTYSHVDAPEWFTDAVVSKMVTNAVAAWGQCGVPAVMSGRDSTKAQPGVIRVQWSEKESGGNFGLANLSVRTLSLGPKAFGLLKSRNPAHDARETLQLVISHEMGHFFGLMAHSRRCVDVLSYYDNGKGEKCTSRDPSQMRTVKEYRHVFPTACDIERCRKTNGLPTLLNGRLVERFGD